MKHHKKYLSILSMLLAMFLLTFASCTKEKSNTENGLKRYSALRYHLEPEILSNTCDKLFLPEKIFLLV